jgi:surfeit locus 1 family protein
MKIRWLPALLILIVVAVTVRLGFWQRDRAHQKEALQAHITQFENAPAEPVSSAPVALKDIEFHRVRARGSFVADKVVYLDNRPYNDQPGFYVVMPFKLADGGYVLVNRGWLPRNIANRTTIEPYATPAGQIEIEGIARADATRAFELGQGGSAAHQLSDDGDKLVRDWPAPDTDVERNYGYMLQWWGMAIAAVGFGLYAARRAAKKEHAPSA